VYRYLIALILLVFPSHYLLADTWVDRDGASWISINALEITIVSIGEFDYFDRIFSKLEPDNTRLNLCFGYDSTSGKPTACLEEVLAARHSYVDDKIRAITLNTQEYGFFTALTVGALQAGAEIVVSIDNNEVYSSYALQRDFKLNDESLRIILESDEDIPATYILINPSSI
jgi:hypothetical protein